MQVRVLTFRKRTQAAEHKKCQWWATLGHSDELESSALTPMALHEIAVHNESAYQQDSEKYHHNVIYLIDHEDEVDKQTSDQELWKESCEFLSITRIHFPQTVYLDGQFKDLKDHFCALAAKEDYRGIAWRTYSSTELSDLVLVSRCAEFNRLSRWSLLATNCGKVGKSYTYFCIPGILLENDIVESGNDKIDYLSMRFAIRNYKTAPDELEKICTSLGADQLFPPYRVAGNEDAVICGRDIPVERVIKLYQGWYKNNLNILNIFSDIITRIGAKGIASDDNFGDNSEDSLLTKICISLLNNITNCQNIERKQWRRPLVELSNALVHMSRSAILDESVYLILPGLYALWENIDSGKLSSIDESLYQRFVELCVHTMEHLMRAEGQLSHHPEVRPIAYDIPVFALEYSAAFLERLNGELTRSDAVKKRNISFLLVPCAETNVSTVELFQATNDTRGLLQIIVPFSFLYEPTLLPALCHELAHYVGEKCRLRKARYDSYIACIANELIRYFFGGILDDRLREYLKCFLVKTLFKGYKKAHAKISVAEDSLQNIAQSINRIVEELSEPAGYADLVRNYLRSSYHGAQFICPNERTLKDGYSRFVRRNDDLRIIFRETYADICMLHFLKLSPAEYLDVALSKDVKELKTYTCLRLLISLHTTQHSLDDILLAVGKLAHLGQEEKSRAQDEIRKLYEEVTHNKFSTEHCLMNYIKACWNELSKNCPESDPSKETVFEFYQKITHDKDKFSYRELLKHIDESRKNNLEWLQVALHLDSEGSIPTVKP